MVTSMTAIQPDQTDERPIACALHSQEFQERKAAITAELLSHVEETRELEDGFAYRLPSGDPWPARVFAFVEAERVCCPFFRFEVVLEPHGGPLWLTLRGSEEVKAFIAGELAPRGYDPSEGR